MKLPGSPSSFVYTFETSKNFIDSGTGVITWPSSSFTIPTVICTAPLSNSSKDVIEVLENYLEEGKVEVKFKEMEPVKLIPYKMAKISEGGEKIEVLDVDIKKITAWKNNRIVFERASFDEIQSTLERW